MTYRHAIACLVLLVMASCAWLPGRRGPSVSCDQARARAKALDDQVIALLKPLGENCERVAMVMELWLEKHGTERRQIHKRVRQCREQEKVEDEHPGWIVVPDRPTCQHHEEALVQMALYDRTRGIWGLIPPLRYTYYRSEAHSECVSLAERQEQCKDQFLPMWLELNFEYAGPGADTTWSPGERAELEQLVAHIWSEAWKDPRWNCFQQLKNRLKPALVYASREYRGCRRAKTCDQFVACIRPAYEDMFRTDYERVTGKEIN